VNVEKIVGDSPLKCSRVSYDAFMQEKEQKIKRETKRKKRGPVRESPHKTKGVETNFGKKKEVRANRFFSAGKSSCEGAAQAWREKGVSFNRDKEVEN